jgi:hypothetical protein
LIFIAKPGKLISGFSNNPHDIKFEKPWRRSI